MKKIVDFLRTILGLATPPRQPEDPSGIHPKSDFDVEEWYRETERLAREIFGEKS